MNLMKTALGAAEKYPENKATQSLVSNLNSTVLMVLLTFVSGWIIYLHKRWFPNNDGVFAFTVIITTFTGELMMGAVLFKVVLAVLHEGV